MPLIQDTFPAPSLDPTRWSDIQDGSVSLTIGVPMDGVYPETVDDVGDAVTITSQSKLIVPGVLDFDTSIFYEDFPTDPDQALVAFLGWRSMQLDGSLQPSYGADILLCRKPDAQFFFQRHTISTGVENRSTIIADPASGADGGFRVVRSGFSYRLYRYDAIGMTWDLLSTEVVPHVGPGFIVFGLFAEDPMAPGFPWVFQT